MPIFNTTYNERKINEAIAKLMGQRIPFLQRFRMGGIGSRRMVIEAHSPFFDDYVDAKHYLTYANFGLRPNGLMVHIHKRLNSYVWAIPYEALNMVATEAGHIKIEAEEVYLLFRDGYKFNQDFMAKVLSLQTQYIKSGNHS